MRPSHILLLLCSTALCSSQELGSTAAFEDGENGLSSRLWLSGQLNIVNQSHPGFPAKYSGPNSLDNEPDQATTGVATLYTGFALTKHTEFFFDLESARGAGVSGALGLGGLSNLDAVTDRLATTAPYVARAQIRQIIALGHETEEATRNPLGLATSVPSRRLEIRVGKMSVTDFFDLNSIGSDSHLQFLNYAIDNNAAYDFAAGSRGYTYGVLLEFYHPGWVLRFGEMFEPTDPNGYKTNWDLLRSRSENYEVEVHRNLVPKRSGVFRLLAFTNHADMGNYPDAVSAYLLGQDPRPDLAAHIRNGQMNYGFGLNGEQDINGTFRLFGRLGWNEGSQEAFQFAEADRTMAIGTDFGGKRWRRADDRIGVAFALNGLTAVHRTYLELGGVSYLLGDNGLDYAKEKVIEGYYNFKVLHGIYLAVDVQHVTCPAYNASRGPVWIFGLRLHLEGDVHFN